MFTGLGRLAIDGLSITTQETNAVNDLHQWLVVGFLLILRFKIKGIGQILGRFKTS